MKSKEETEERLDMWQGFLNEAKEKYAAWLKRKGYKPNIKN